jgi:hypothetical protein
VGLINAPTIRAAFAATSIPIVLQEEATSHASPRRASALELERMQALYRERYNDFTVTRRRMPSMCRRSGPRMVCNPVMVKSLPGTASFQVAFKTNLYHITL